MIVYILHRLLSMGLSLFGVSLLVFFMVHLIPGDAALAILGERATEEALTELRRQMGLDQPLHKQYGVFLWDLVHFDLGRSFKTNQPVIEEILRKFPATVELTLAAMIFSVFFGIAAGIVAAINRGKFWDYTTMFGSLAGISMPIFWLGLMLILLLAYTFPIFPSSQRLDAVLDLDIQHRTHFYLIDTLLAGNFAAFQNAIAHLILPAITLGTIPLAIIARMTRSSLLEVLNQQYIVTAYAKGLPKWVVILKHALKNSIIPVLTVIGLQFGYLMGGAILTEHIFSWPGLGSWLRAAVEARDIRPVQGGVLFVATVFMTVNLIVDLLYAYFDPRIRIGEEAT
ncbi:peptide ABC transporter permease [Candidatus Poribacteria bacterium]|nr:MAG: peptide ABC transporter permease [Candidatus Poribacteria bacterium]